ncbi:MULTISPECIES: hypothetical protein [Thermomonas]|jgi:hypothetical protein|uniref:hypothetical protein n=1 Tax=Thermomonas TaxID=141948 RepID=UPI0012EC3324|nr:MULTISPECIES: hypothetical protein [Thermomonas]
MDAILRRRTAIHFLRRSMPRSSIRLFRKSVPAVSQSQKMRRNMSLWIKLEQLVEVCRKSLTGRGKFPPSDC